MGRPSKQRSHLLDHLLQTRVTGPIGAEFEELAKKRGLAPATQLRILVLEFVDQNRITKIVFPSTRKKKG